MQCPHRRPAAVPVAHPPRGQALGPGALPAPQHLGSHTQQPQYGVGALHRTHAVTGVSGQPLIRRPAVTPGGVIGIPCPRPSDRQQRAPADRIARHHRAHLRVVAAVIGHRHRKRRPPLHPPGPARHPRPRRLPQLEHDRRHRRRLRAPASLMISSRQPRCPRPRTHHTTTRPHRRTPAIPRLANF